MVNQAAISKVSIHGQALPFPEPCLIQWTVLTYGARIKCFFSITYIGIYISLVGKIAILGTCNSAT